ncbi:MAG: ribulose-phosphate 3-epimerase [Bacteroidales bacterium]|nr:ribulose-phosphate 3-epimerase [Bacteroidales bacterium]
MKKHPHLVAPSLLSADFANLQAAIEMINESEADWFHVDVMDGMFVPNITIGMPVIKAIKKHAQKPLDVHLMIRQPERFLEDFKKAGADVLSVHYEESPHLHRTIQAIKNLGMKAGVVINPHTPVTALNEIISEADLFLIMGVNPGFGGQQFIHNTTSKVIDLKQLIADHKSKALIEVDGGVTLNNAKELIDAGTDVLVAGNTIFSSSDPVKTIRELKEL